MAMKELNERQTMKVESDRAMQVYKRDDMIQKGRYELSLQEQRCVLYAISKIKSDDSVFQEYTFELSDFYRMCGLDNESYTELKAILKGLSDKSWWVTIDDKGTESLVRWFSTLRTNQGSGNVTIKFHEDMMPYLLELANQGKFFTHFELKYVLPMKSQYAIRLYELLKSYQKNNREWFFEVDKLKKLLNCENYTRFPDFRRWVIEPAVEEINEYTDIIVAWEPVRQGRKVVRVTFYMVKKKETDMIDVDYAIRDSLDGKPDLEQIMSEERNSVKAKFFRENSDDKYGKGD